MVMIRSGNHLIEIYLSFGKSYVLKKPFSLCTQRSGIDGCEVNLQLIILTNVSFTNKLHELLGDP